VKCEAHILICVYNRLILNDGRKRKCYRAAPDLNSIRDNPKRLRNKSAKEQVDYLNKKLKLIIEVKYIRIILSPNLMDLVVF